LQHDHGVGGQVEVHLLLRLEVGCLRPDGLLLEIVLVIGLSRDDGLGGGGFQPLETGEVDVRFLGIAAGIAELDEQLTGLRVEDDRLPLELGGIVDGDAVAVIILSRRLSE